MTVSDLSRRRANGRQMERSGSRVWRGTKACIAETVKKRVALNVVCNGVRDSRMAGVYDSGSVEDRCFGVGSRYEDIGQMYSSYDEMPFKSCAARSMSVVS